MSINFVVLHPHRSVFLSAWSLANATGPLIGGTIRSIFCSDLTETTIAGALAQHGAWRWLFYLNLFTSGGSAILVSLLLKLKTPEGTIPEKLARMDWM